MSSNSARQIEKSWMVKTSSKARKGEEGLPEKLKAVCQAAKRALMKTGACVGFDHFGPLKQLGPRFYHCHLGVVRKTTYVMYWEVNDRERVITIRFIGSHENANY